MRSIKRVILYETTDGLRFTDFSEAQACQSARDLTDADLEFQEVSYSDIDLEIFKVDIKNRNELNVLLDFLHYYYKFENIYNDYDKLSYPITVQYELENKTIKIL